MRNLFHRDVEARLFALKRQAGAHAPHDPTARCALRCRMRPCPSQACPVTRAPPAATCRGSGHPITHCGLQCARRHARRHQLHQHCGRGHRDGHWRRIGALYGRRSHHPIACCTAADACCLCAPQDRLRALLRVSPSSWALSACILRAAHGYVRLAACGVRGEERGRDARATGWRAEVRDISALTWAYLGTP